jgi:hypothetical protein
MAIDSEKSKLAAQRGDVAGLAINGTIAFYAIAKALTALSAKSAVDLSEEIDAIREVAKLFSDRFDNLVGWSDDGRG